MPKFGGSATIYGILYQILGTAHWAAKIRVKTRIDGDDWIDARIIVEPRGGGDVRIETPRRRVIEQWKSKSGGGAWSLRSLIDDVLPDLYRAVDVAPGKPDAEYRFVTEGHRGRWSVAERFFAELRHIDVPADPLSSLDDLERLSFLPERQDSRRGFFRHILECLRSHKDIAAESESDGAKKLWHLLGRFSLYGNRSAEQVARELDSYLLPIVDFREQVEAKRRELCTALFELGADGDATFSPNELLAKVGLNHESFANWIERREKLLNPLERSLSRKWHYNAQADVRSIPRQSSTASIVVFSGDSGKGKTWRLSSFALDAFANGLASVAISATGVTESDLRSVAKAIWRTAFERDSETDLELIAKKRRDFFPGTADPWLTVCVDDVQSASEARSLASWDWVGSEMRLAISTLPPIARALKTQFREDVEVIDVDEFTVPELQKYLDDSGQNWSLLPVDVRTLLRQPLLAKLYCDIADVSGWRPFNEFMLLERYWFRIRDDRDQADHPGDSESLIRLASTFLTESIVYPWSQSIVQQSGMTPECLRRLEGVGWLRRLEDDRVEVAHDRLLNWAVAKAVFAKRSTKVITTEDLATTLVPYFRGEKTKQVGRTLADVTLDVLWMLSNEADRFRNDIPIVLAALEDPSGIWKSEPLYKNILPLLGPGIIGAVVERTKSTLRSAERPSPLPRFLADAIIQTGKQHPNDAADWGNRLIRDSDQEIRESGVLVLKRFPNPAALDELWNIHKQNFAVFDRQEGEHWWVGYEQTFDALRSCVQLQPEWLERQIEQSNANNEPITELAYLVANLPGNTGVKLWKRAKQQLLLKVPIEKPRALVTCIQQHADVDEIARLEAWLTYEHDSTQQMAFAALVDLCPDKALKALSHLRSDILYLTREWWLPGLLLRKPEETRQVIRKRISDSTEPRWMAANVYESDPNQMDAATLDLLLDELEDLAEQRLADTSKERKNLHKPLSLLAGVTRHDLLQRFESHLGKTLETLLSALVGKWGGRASVWHDYELDYAAQILVKIGGLGLTSVVNQFLKCSGRFAKFDGIQLCLVNPDEETRRLLKELSQTDEKWDEKDNFPSVQCDATVALAALGENRAVVDSILKWGWVPNDLWEIREGCPPMSDADLQSAITSLESVDQGLRSRSVWAVSVSGRGDLAARIRGILKESKPDSGLARAAVVALAKIGDRHPDLLELLQSQLPIDEHSYAAICALLRLGDVRSLDILLNEFRRRGYVPHHDVTELLVANLGSRKETRRGVAEIVWNGLSTNPFHFSTEIYDCLSELKSVEVLEFLIEQANQPEHGMPVAGQKVAAIRALAKLDADAAFRACEAAMRLDQNDRNFYPKVLIEIDGARAIPILINTHIQAESHLTKWAISRVFRSIAEQFDVRATLQRLLHTESGEERMTGVEIAAWQQDSSWTEQLLHVARHDSDRRVRREAEHGLARIEANNFGLDLLQAIEQATGSRVWSYLDGLVKMCDPWLLTSENDPLWIGRALSTKSTALHIYVDRLLEKAQKHVEKKAEKLDKRKT